VLHNDVFKAYIGSKPREKPLEFNTLAAPLLAVRKAMKDAEKIASESDLPPTI
jgi:hypothetical protein